MRFKLAPERREAPPLEASVRCQITLARSPPGRKQERVSALPRVDDVRTCIQALRTDSFSPFRSGNALTQSTWQGPSKTAIH